MSSRVDAALSRRNARRFLAAVLVSGFGSTAMMLVAGVWAKELTGSDAAAGWMSVAMWGPVVAAPWLGGIADRVGHRRVLVGGNLLIGAALLSLTLVDHGGGLALLGAVMALYGLSFVLLDVAEGGVLPTMVSDAVLADINGRRMALQEGAKIVAPAAGAALFVVIGGGGVAMVDAATFLVAAGAIAAMRPLPERSGMAPRSDDAVGGTGAVRMLRARSGLWRSTLVGAATMLAAGTAGPVMFAVVDDGLGRPAAFLGVLAAIQGAGSVVAGFAVGPLLRRWSGPTIVGRGTLLVVVGLMARASGSVAVVALGSFCVGAGLPAVIATSITRAQRTAHPASTASMVGAVTTMLFVPHALGLVTGSLIVEHLDHRLLLVTCAAGLLAAAAALGHVGPVRAPALLGRPSTTRIHVGAGRRDSVACGVHTGVEGRTDVSNADIVRACFESYVRQDRDRAERIIGDPFVFTSPQDDHIDRVAYFQRCFPTMERLRRHELLHVTPTAGDDVFVLYEYELTTGEVFRNTEVLTVRDDRIVEAQVFFGGRVDR